MARSIITALLLAWSGLALAASPKAVRDQVEASMLVNGEIAVDVAGGVAGYSFDRSEKLPEYVRTFLEQNIAGWRFEPMLVDGRPVASRNRMGLLLVARPTGDTTFDMELRNTSFHPIAKAGRDPQAAAMDPPSYPKEAAAAGVSGTVYLLLKIGADGNVAEAMAEQVNLHVAASEKAMKQWRGVLARNALVKARQWKFLPPTDGSQGDDGSWSVRVPVAYSFEPAARRYGQWQAYIPGPRERAPWVTDDVAPDALADGGVYPVGGTGGLRLLDRTGG
ncbi:energy transducer TonB [Pseudoxanthomonas koreensis]|uniref:energy transducer TonB n=1 Tax=Pseudoxanthomonas koreensis TaxID=266061 RepID=UPI001390A989|nr:energy transducer TonB [Pseudoxanthomonas koreensis]KAF1689512.1 hypothetical protein CSC64_12700 [Pseudoxanthomonas koreensis]